MKAIGVLLGDSTITKYVETKAARIKELETELHELNMLLLAWKGVDKDMVSFIRQKISIRYVELLEWRFGKKLEYIVNHNIERRLR